MLRLALILALTNQVNLLSECPATPVSPIHRDTLVSQDTAFVITTACAPICSSIVRVYKVGEHWQLIRTVTTPDEHWAFPEAYFENNQLLWRDNTPELLDDEEKTL